MQTVHIHIGSPKTGTSSLQGFLTANSDALRNQGLLYPRTGFLDKTTGIAQHHIAFSLSRTTPAWVTAPARPLAALADDLADEMAQAGSSPDLILSSEAFSSLKAARRCHLLHNLVPGAALKIILCLRRPSRQAISWFQQAIRAHPFSDQDFSRFLRGYRFVFLESLGFYRSAFGAQNVTVVDYDELCKTKTIEQGFLELIGVRSTASFRAPPARNTTPPPAVLKLLHQLNRIGQGQIPTPLRQRLYQQIIAAAPGVLPVSDADSFARLFLTDHDHRALETLDQTWAGAYRAALSPTPRIYEAAS